MKSIEVCLTAAGTPLSFVRDSRVWRVAIEPLRWYEHVAWWETTQRMPRSQMSRLDIVKYGKCKSGSATTTDPRW